MKKFLTILAISSAILSTGLIAQGLSYYRNSNCNRNHCLPVRKTTNRIFSYNQYQTLRRIARLRRIKKNEGNKYSFWKNYNRQAQQPFNKVRYSEYRASHSNFFPRNNNTLPKTHKIVVRETAYQQNFNIDSRFQAKKYKKDFFAESKSGYTVSFPVDFTKEDNGEYYDTQRDLTIKISKGLKFSCGELNFQLCASKKGAESREKNGLKNVKKLSQKFGLKEMIINGKLTMAPTYRESFVAGEYGSEKVYFFYTILNPHNKTIVNLEGIAPAQNEYASENLVNAIFRKIQL
jgi:hypothetical protein